MDMPVRSIPDGALEVKSAAAGPTQASQTVYDAIMAAAADPGPINIVAYSGGAGAFAAAVKQLPADVIARIASVTYLSPGAYGNIPTGPWKTNIYLGIGIDSTMAEWFTTWQGDQGAGSSFVHQTNCYHTDTSCFILAAGIYSSWSTNGSSPCSNPSVFSSPPNNTLGLSTKTVVTPGYGPFGYGGQGGVAQNGYAPPGWDWSVTQYFDAEFFNWAATMGFDLSNPSVTSSISYNLP